MPLLGRLEVITGCMFAGKTTELIRRLERVKLAQQKFLLFKPSIDNRYGTKEVKAHNEQGIACFLLPPEVKEVAELIKIVGANLFEEAGIIAFDECNFFQEKFPALCESLAQDYGKRVIVAGLNLGFDGKPFHPMTEIISLADEVDVLTAICMKCGREATRSQRVAKGKAVHAGPKIEVGGIGDYEARCRTCWEKPKQRIE